MPGVPTIGTELIDAHTGETVTYDGRDKFGRRYIRRNGQRERWEPYRYASTPKRAAAYRRRVGYSEEVLRLARGHKMDPAEVVRWLSECDCKRREVV